MSQETLPEFGISKNIKQVGRTDLPGGGLVTVENGYAYVGHIDPPYGTSIVDVHDPKHPKPVSQLEVPEGIHSHKVRVSGDVMLVNRFTTIRSMSPGSAAVSAPWIFPTPTVPKKLVTTSPSPGKAKRQSKAMTSFAAIMDCST